jgi:hypothetical protein
MLALSQSLSRSGTNGVTGLQKETGLARRRVGRPLELAPVIAILSGETSSTYTAKRLVVVVVKLCMLFMAILLS